MIFAPAEIKLEMTPSPNPGPYDGSTYYDQSPIKPSHYRWMITGYFFTGGLASAAQFLATVIDLFGGETDRAAVRGGRYLALLGALISPPLLIIDLNTPQRWYNMLRIFRKTSAMSIGSWALSGFGLFSGIAAAGQALEDLFGLRLGRWMARLAELPASLMAGVVAIYTGTLLAATNVPFWASGFPFPSSLFASSAASTAVAALTLLTPVANTHTRQKLAGFGLVSGLAELFFAARIQQQWHQDHVETPLRTPPIGAGWYAGVLGLGILIPLGLHAAQVINRRETRRVSTLAALAVLVGGLCLRGVFVFGGRPSAVHAQDYFHMTQAGHNGRRQP